MQRVAEKEQPELERRYTALHDAGKEDDAAAELAAFTAHTVAAAVALLERLTEWAAGELGLDAGILPDDVLANALDWQSRVWFPPRD